MSEYFFNSRKLPRVPSPRAVVLWLHRRCPHACAEPHSSETGMQSRGVRGRLRPECRDASKSIVSWVTWSERKTPACHWVLRQGLSRSHRKLVFFSGEERRGATVMIHLVIAYFHGLLCDKKAVHSSLLALLPWSWCSPSLCLLGWTATTSVECG